MNGTIISHHLRYKLRRALESRGVNVDNQTPHHKLISEAIRLIRTGGGTSGVEPQRDTTTAIATTRVPVSLQIVAKAVLSSRGQVEISLFDPDRDTETRPTQSLEVPGGVYNVIVTHDDIQDAWRTAAEVRTVSFDTDGNTLLITGDIPCLQLEVPPGTYDVTLLAAHEFTTHAGVDIVIFVHPNSETRRRTVTSHPLG